MQEVEAKKQNKIDQETIDNNIPTGYKILPDNERLATLNQLQAALKEIHLNVGKLAFAYTVSRAPFYICFSSLLNLRMKLFRPNFGKSFNIEMSGISGCSSLHILSNFA